MKKVVFVDTGVLIAAARGRDEVSRCAMEVLDDPNLAFASSDLIRLETMPKALYYRKKDEADFYQTYFSAVQEWAKTDAALVRRAYDEAVRAGLSALDALHVACAQSVGAAELVTTEKSTKEIHRATLLPIRSITPE